MSMNQRRAIIVGPVRWREVGAMKTQSILGNKRVSKLTVAAAVATLVASGTASFADDQQLQNRLAIQRAQESFRARQATVTLYVGQRGFDKIEVRRETPRRVTIYMGRGSVTHLAAN
jgi:hypothetical protein